MRISPDTAAAHRHTDHGTVYFCSPHCAATFDADPHHHATPAAKSRH
jgi:Cu+-exporting ATPase